MIISFFRMASANISVVTMTNLTHHDVSIRWEPYEFLTAQPVLSILLITILVIASVVGSGGNILILVSIATQRNLQNVESVFVVNLACCDLYVTLIADPLSIVGKLRCCQCLSMWICCNNIFMYTRRPDMTSVVDWALKANCIALCIYSYPSTYYDLHYSHRSVTIVPVSISAHSDNEFWCEAERAFIVHV